jgi:hypothetical protein
MDNDDTNLVNLFQKREAKADKAGNAGMWTPHDAVLEVSRMIAAREIDPDALVIVWREKIGPGATTTNFRIAGPDLHTTLGLLSLGAARIRKEAADA